MAPIEYPICTPNGPFQTAQLATPMATSYQVDQKPLISNSHTSNNSNAVNDNHYGNHHHPQHKQKNLSELSLNMRLKHYQSYLDDHHASRRRRTKHIAMRKYCMIMQSIKTKSRDLFQFEYHEENESDDDDDDDDVKLFGYSREFSDPFEQTQGPASIPTAFMGICRPKKKGGASSSNRLGGRCDLDGGYNRILRKHRARIAEEGNQYALPWEASATNAQYHHPLYHHTNRDPNDIGLSANNVL